MNVKNFDKLIATILLFVFILSMLGSAVFATSSGTQGTTGGVNGSALDSELGEIVAILLYIAAAVCTGKFIHIGILFLLGSVQDKSNAKAALIPWLVGTVIFSSAAVLGPAIINLIGKGFIDKPVLTY